MSGAPAPPAGTFYYVGVDVDEASGVVECHYRLSGCDAVSGGRPGHLDFVERVSVGPGLDWGPEAHEAARLVYLLCGVSYYKAGAPPVIDLGGTPMRPGEAPFLRRFYLDGLGEFAYRNGLDLTGLVVTGGSPVPGAGGPRAPAVAARPLVPFGGGVDSIVTAEALRGAVEGPTLFVLSRPGDRFAAIEAAAAVSGLPLRRAGRELDARLLDPAGPGLLDGHVPVTGIVSAVAVLVAALAGHDAVVMSNERSASSGNLRVGDRWINHQWSKSLAFEDGFAAVVGSALGGAVAYFSALRPCSELWVAQRFASLERYHPVFRSCNRAFALDPARRAQEWCGRCDKCCFVDLVLAPFMAAGALRAVFAGREPLEDPTLADRFRTLVGLPPASCLPADTKPWECVGDVEECRAALRLAGARPDRAGTPTLEALVAELAGDQGGGGDVGGGPGAGGEDGGTGPGAGGDMLVPAGEHRVPEHLAAALLGLPRAATIGSRTLPACR